MKKSITMKQQLTLGGVIASYFLLQLLRLL